MNQPHPKPPIIDTVCRMVAGIKEIIKITCQHKWKDEYAVDPLGDVVFDPVQIAQYLRESQRHGGLGGELPVKIGGKYVFGAQTAPTVAPPPVIVPQGMSLLDSVKALMQKGGIRFREAAQTLLVSEDALR